MRGLWVVVGAVIFGLGAFAAGYIIGTPGAEPLSLVIASGVTMGWGLYTISTALAPPL